MGWPGWHMVEWDQHVSSASKIVISFVSAACDCTLFWFVGCPSSKPTSCPCSTVVEDDHPIHSAISPKVRF